MGHHSCCNKQKVKRGLWSPEEDEKLVNFIAINGHGCWNSVPNLSGLQRCGKSCRLRWINYLRPDLKRGGFSVEEVTLIIEIHKIIGNKWAQIASYLPGRTDNEVKNFWNSVIKKKVLSSKGGIIPRLDDYNERVIYSLKEENMKEEEWNISSSSVSSSSSSKYSSIIETIPISDNFDCNSWIEQMREFEFQVVEHQLHCDDSVLPCSILHSGYKTHVLDDLIDDGEGGDSDAPIVTGDHHVGVDDIDVELCSELAWESIIPNMMPPSSIMFM